MNNQLANMKYIWFFIFLAISSCATKTNIENSNLEYAFNGKDLNGWVAPENNIWWTANNGILSAHNGPDKKGSILWTEESFENFVIELDFLMGKGTVDSGIFLRTEKQQIQIGESGSLKRDMTGSIYIPGKSYPGQAKGVDELLQLNDWNTIKVHAKGNLYQVWLNEKQVLTYQSEDGIESGPIGLQLHPNREMSIDFKNIKIGKLN